MKPHAFFTRNYIEGFITQTRRINSLGLNKYWKFLFSLDYYLEWLDDFIIGNNSKGTAKENWKGWKLITLALDPDPWKFYLMFLSREIDKKLCQIYTKILLYNIIYKFVIRHKNSHQSAVYWSRDTDRDMWKQYWTAIGGSSGDIIRTVQTIRNTIINYIY